MNKEELVKAVAEKADMSQKDAKALLDATLEVVNATLGKSDAALEDRKVTLVGFGTFHVKLRKAREGRNPRDGKVIKIPEKLVPVFSAGKGLREKVAVKPAKKGKK